MIETKLVISFLLGGGIFAAAFAFAFLIYWIHNITNDLQGILSEFQDIAVDHHKALNDVATNQVALYEMLASAINDFRQTISFQQRAMQELIGDVEDETEEGKE